MAKLLPLQKFIEEKYPWFVIDEHNNEIILKLNQWCWRDKSFEIINPKWNISRQGNLLQSKFFLDKGFCMFGPVGAGKTDVMRIVAEYNRYLQSPYSYRMDVAWAYSDRYKLDGGNCFANIRGGNIFFDELCLTDATGYPTKEISSHFGNKVLVGEEIIRLREVVFTNTGCITHFTTNEKWDKIEEVYGARALSRLFKMCNIIPYLAPDRRFNSTPVIHNNTLNPTVQSIEATSAFDEEEADARIKKGLNEKYIRYKATGMVQGITLLDFNYLKMFGVECATEQQIRDKIVPVIIEKRKKILNEMKSASIEEHRERERLKEQYNAGNLSRKELDSIAAESKSFAVINHFKKLVEEKKELIF